MKVIIPLAGEGRRMRPHTHTKPKPLLNVAGKPGMAYILDELKKLDVSEIIFITGHLKNKVESFVKKNYSDFKCRFIEQKAMDGTAGAIKLAEEFINEPLMIIFVDTIFDADLTLIKKLKKDEAGIIWAKEVEDYQRFGVCVLNGSGHLTKIVEKPSTPISKLANIGLYYVKDYKLMFEGIKHIYEVKKTLKGEYFLTDAFEYMIEKGAKIICPPVKGWYDTGKPETLLESNRELLKKSGGKIVKTENSVIIPPVFLADGVKISNSVIGPYVTVESGVEIKNSIVKDSVIGSDSKISDALLEASIIGDFAVIDDIFKSLNVGDHGVITFSEKKK
jgi:glucose-1-phosphate thymidylyltransferase